MDVVDDGVILLLYYENRVLEVNLFCDDVGDEIVDIIE